MKKISVIILALLACVMSYAQHRINSFFDDMGIVRLETQELKESSDTLVNIFHRTDDVNLVLIFFFQRFYCTDIIANLVTLDGEVVFKRNWRMVGEAKNLKSLFYGFCHDFFCTRFAIREIAVSM